MEYDEVVAVDDLPGEGRAILVGQLAGLPPEQQRELTRVEVDQAARDRLTMLIDKVDRIPGGERSVCAGDAGRQQGQTPSDHRLDGTRIEVQATPWSAGMREPEKASRSTAPDARPPRSRSRQSARRA